MPRLRAPHLALCAAPTLLLSACGAAPEPPPQDDEGPQGIYIVDAETGATRAAITNADGTTTMRSGADIDAELPAGFTLYPGARIRDAVEIGRGSGRAVQMSFASDAAPADLMAHYRREAEGAGIRIGVRLDTDALSMIGGSAPDGTDFTFQTRRADGETTGQLTVGRGLD